MRRMMIALGTLLALALLAPLGALAQAPSAQLRLMFESPDALSVDMFVDGQMMAGGAASGTTTNYQSVAPGPHHVQLAPAGMGVSATMLDTTVDLRRGKSYTLLTLGGLANMQAKLLADTSHRPQQGEVRVRVIQAAPTVGTIDVYTNGSNIPILTDQYFGSADYVNIKAGSYTFSFHPADTTQVALTSPMLTFEPGWVYTVVVAEPNGMAPMAGAVVDRVAQP